MSSMQVKSLIATAAIFCCRFTGLLREVCFTALFGATGLLDAFLTAYRLPNMLRDMFAEGALSQSFTSVMSKVEQKEGAEASWKLASRVMTQLSAVMLIMVSAGVLASGFLMQQLYPERAHIELRLDASLNDLARYDGMRQLADGAHEALITSGTPIDEFSEQSSVNYAKLSAIPVGQTLQLTSRQLTLPDSGTKLRVESRNMMQLASDLCRIMWPFIMLASLSALCMGALNVFGIFGLPNLASAGFNITLLIFGCTLGWWIDPNFGADSLYGFAIAVVLGGVTQIIIQLPKLWKLGFRPRFDIGLRREGLKISFADEHVRKVWMLMLPGVIAAGVTQSNIFVNTSFALYLPSGSVTALSCAFHLWQLPVALFGVAMGMVVLPAVSRMSLTQGNSDIAEHLARALRFVAFFAMPSAVFLGIWGEQIVSVFFQRGRFDADSSILTGQVLASYSLGLLGYAGMKVLQPVFLALERPWAPAGLAVLSCAMSITLNYIFVHVLHFGVNWLALTTSVTTTLNFLFYFFLLRYLLGGMAGGLLFRGLLRILLASVLLAVICYAAREFLMQGFNSWNFISRFAMMAVGGTLAGLFYLIVSYLLRVSELRDLLGKLRTRSH